jgi:hypothetical protein
MLKRYSVLLALAGLVCFASQTSKAATLVVDDTLSCPGATYMTIQAAVTAAAPGDTIKVCAGTYNENVDIPATLTGLSLKGAKAGVFYAFRTFGSASESTVRGVLSTGTGVITVRAPNVTIDGFSVTNSPTLFASLGIVVKQTGNAALITNNIFDTVTTADLSVNGTAQAVYLETGPDNVKILANKMNNIRSNRSAKGVLIGSNGGTDPSQNTLIFGNYISNVTSDTRGAYGVSVASVPNISGLQIVGNVIDKLTGTLGWAHAIGLEGDTPGVKVLGNSISNVVAPGVDRMAVWFESNPSFSSGQVNYNNFNDGIVVYGIAVHPLLTGTPVDGKCNWWGSSSGPGPVGPGSGAKVSPNVTYQPWLTSPAPFGKCNGPKNEKDKDHDHHSDDDDD